MNPFLDIIASKSLLSHPFYIQWQAGTLPRSVFAPYAEQYYHLETFFPRLLSRVHANCEDVKIRQEITDNLYDEEHGERNHRELWLEFVEAADAVREQVEQKEALPETRRVIERLQEIASRSTISGVAALAAYEAQIPDVAATKVDGLIHHYGFADDRGLDFFRVHQLLDREHAQTWWEGLERLIKSEDDRREAQAAVAEACDALRFFLDGVSRAYLPA